jgi:hypothetical protein
MKEIKTNDYQLTIFKNIFDKNIDNRLNFKDWTSFKKFLYDLSKKPGYKLKRGEKYNGQSSPLISPAIFNEKNTRKNSNVLYWGKWIALDIDNICTLEINYVKNILRRFSNYSFLCYSSASSTQKNPKFRIILPLTEVVSMENIKHFWFALNSKFENIVDPQTKDLCRMYYVPAQYPNAYNFIFDNTAEHINPIELMSKYEYIPQKIKRNIYQSLPEEFRTKLQQYKLEKIEKKNITYSWTSYRDCPFVNKDLVAEYFSIAHIDGTGRYLRIYQLMVSIASNALKRGYLITPNEIVKLIQEIDNLSSKRYGKRPLDVEAERAIQYVCSSNF